MTLAAKTIHWTEQYLGRPYAAHDCAQFAELVLWEVFGRRIRLPSERCENVRGLSDLIEAHLVDFAEPTEDPAEGDGVLMIGRGRLNHIGVYCLIQGRPWVVHSMRDAGQVCLHRLRDLPTHGLMVDGFYKWLDTSG